ncbi:hypothetical protein HDU67_008589 [Dinochytrium kinnereticum]|nr:hypothetical protein HDU67_008589 [Dinochytrium kinnereticum]
MTAPNTTHPGASSHTPESRREEGIKRMGSYMLGGWVLTDVPCPTRGCEMPTFRAKEDRSKFVCALCDDASRPFPPVVLGVFSDSDASARHREDEELNSSSIGMAVAALQTFTPLLCLENLLPPTNDDDDLEDADDFPPLTQEETNRILRRREASDRASRLMGQKLLEGWTMLADVCESEACGDLCVPLLRRGEVVVCVLCGWGGGEVGRGGALGEVVGGGAEGEVVEAPTRIQTVTFGTLDAPPTPTAPTATPPTTLRSSLKRPATELEDVLSDGGEEEDVVEAMVATLLSRMKGLRVRLGRCGGGVKEVLEICRAVEACADAVRACRAIGGV